MRRTAKGYEKLYDDAPSASVEPEINSERAHCCCHLGGGEGVRPRRFEAGRRHRAKIGSGVEK